MESLQPVAPWCGEKGLEASVALTGAARGRDGEVRTAPIVTAPRQGGVGTNPPSGEWKGLRGFLQARPRPKAPPCACLTEPLAH